MQTTLNGEKILNKDDIPKPFLKWAGGKTQLLGVLDEHLPIEIKESGKIDKYFEPFVGGGAFFFYLSSHYDVKEAYLSDINKELILTYNVIKNSPMDLIDKLDDISNDYINETNNQKKYFYKIREDFNNELIDFNYDDYSERHIKRASQMIFLNKTCFNGLFRVNKKGEFNVPFANSKKPLICDKNNILNVSKALQNVNIVAASYQDSEKFIDDSSFVYLDPPYRPLNNFKSFNGYSKADFDDDSQIELAKFYGKISEKGAYALLSNSDPKNVDESDDFFDVLYSNFKIFRVDANRSINSNGEKRGPIKEILVSNF